MTSVSCVTLGKVANGAGKCGEQETPLHVLSIEIGHNKRVGWIFKKDWIWTTAVFVLNVGLHRLGHLACSSLGIILGCPSHSLQRQREVELKTQAVTLSVKKEKEMAQHGERGEKQRQRQRQGRGTRTCVRTCMHVY